MKKIKKNKKKPRVIVVMPAYNAEKTLEKTYKDLPKHIVDKVILVDDGSKDRTVEIAKKLGIKFIVHMQNRGYGSNQKTCYIEALSDGADIIVMLHPDYQYDSRLVPEMIAPIMEGHADFVLGSRMLGHGALKGGMPLYKYIANKLLTMFENFILGKHYSELHSGFRAYSRKCLLSIPFTLNSDDFVFDTEMIAQVEMRGFPTSEIPVPTRYFKEASSINFFRSVIYGLQTIKVMFEFLLHKWGIKKYDKFSKTLLDVLSPYYIKKIKKWDKNK
ncbi:MAG: glycosyltransferase family 2 protein [Candidatus Goldbacteria bacterium]|nr:glycosyltransferase family 2 protein [Candidatus Goldiibacteriota bacterium]